jgi:sugar/nucleoside kinase (ribokinase family)
VAVQVEHIQKAENWAIVESAQYFYMAGFFLTVSPQTIQLVAQHAAENNKWFIMNLSAPFLCQFFKGVDRPPSQGHGLLLCLCSRSPDPPPRQTP